MSEINRDDLREVAKDLKESFGERCDHVEERLGDQIRGVNERLDKLNSKTDRNITDIAALQRDVRVLEAAKPVVADDPPKKRTGLTLTLALPGGALIWELAKKWLGGGMTSALRDVVDRAALAANPEPRIVRAVVEQESSGNPWAWNPEPSYRYLWDVRANRPFRGLAWSETIAKFPPADFPALGGDRDQEWWGQQASWGLMQVMGAVARERGFRGLYLPELCEPSINLAIGCAHLAAALKWADGDVRLALGSYNAGRGGADSAKGRAYADKVLGRAA